VNAVGFISRTSLHAGFDDGDLVEEAPEVKVAPFWRALSGFRVGM